MAFTSVFGQYLLVSIVIGFFFFRTRLLDFVGRLSQTSPTPSSNFTDNKPQNKKRQKGTPRLPEKSKTTVEGNEKPVTGEKEKTVDDAAFAKELALAQKGTDLTKRSDVKKRKAKTKKQGQAEEKIQVAHPSAEASHRPLIESEWTPQLPEEQPIDLSASANGSGATGMTTDYELHVADSLRITSEPSFQSLPQESQWTSVPTKNQKAQKKIERSEETKKQRQRQAQKEQMKELKDEADRKQRALMEKQRREARVARGEPARNGENYAEFPAPVKNVWTQPAQRRNSVENDTDLLDTIDAPSTGQ